MSEDKYISRSHRIANNEALLPALQLGRIIIKEDEVYGVKGNHLKVRTNFWGYPQTVVKIRGRAHSFFLHKIIWVAANGIVPNGLEIDHIDRNKKNYRLSNLRLLSSEDNLDRRRTVTAKPAF